MESKKKKKEKIEYKMINYWLNILNDKKKQINLLSSILKTYCEFLKEQYQLIKSMIKNREKLKEYSQEPSNLFKYVGFIIASLEFKVSNEYENIINANKEIQKKINGMMNDLEIDLKNFYNLLPTKFNEIDKINEILSTSQNFDNKSKKDIENLSEVYKQKLEEKDKDVKKIIENIILRIFKGHVYLNQLLFLITKAIFDAYNNIKNYIIEKKDDIFELIININDYNERKFSQNHGIYYEPFHFNDNYNIDDNVNVSKLCDSFYYYMKSFIQNIKIRKKIMMHLIIVLKTINENQNNYLITCINKINNYLNENNLGNISQRTWNLFIIILKYINSFHKNLDNIIPSNGFKNEENIIENITKINIKQFENNWIKYGEKVRSLKNEYEKITDKNLKINKEKEIKKYIYEECIPLLKENLIKIRESQNTFCSKATTTFEKYTNFILEYSNDCIDNTKSEIDNLINEDLFEEINYFIEKYYEQFENKYSEEEIHNEIQIIQLKLLTEVKFDKDNFNKNTVDGISNYFSNIQLSRIDSVNIESEQMINLSNVSFEEEIPIELSNNQSNNKDKNESIKFQNKILNKEKSIDMTNIKNDNSKNLNIENKKNDNEEINTNNENYLKKSSLSISIDDETFKRQFSNRNRYINYMLKKINFTSRLNSITSKRMNIFEKEYSNDPIFFLPKKEFEHCLINEKDFGNKAPLTIVFHYIFNPYITIKQYPQKKSFFESIFIERGDMNTKINYEQNQKELIPIYFDDLDYVANLFYNIDENELNDFLNEIKNWEKKIQFELNFIHPIQKLMIGPDRITIKDLITVYFISPTDLIIDYHSYGSDFPFADTFVSIMQYRFHCDFIFNIDKGYFEFKTNIKLLHTVKLLKKMFLESELKKVALKKNKNEIINHVYNPLVEVVKCENKNFHEMAIKLFEENIRRNLHKFNELSKDVLDFEKNDILKKNQDNKIKSNLKNEITFTNEKNKNVKVEEGNMTFYSMFGIIFVLFVKILMEQNSFFDSVLSFIIIFLLIYFFYQTNHDKK